MRNRCRTSTQLLAYIRQVAAAICICMIWLGFHPQISPAAGCQELHVTQIRNVSFDPTSVPAKWHLIPSNGLSGDHECDRQTENAKEKCVAIVGIAIHTRYKKCRGIDQYRTFGVTCVSEDKRLSSLQMMRVGVEPQAFCCQSDALTLDHCCVSTCGREGEISNKKVKRLLSNTLAALQFFSTFTSIVVANASRGEK